MTEKAAIINAMPAGIADPNRVYDGWTSLSGGQDAGREPNLIELNQAARLENIVCRGGNPQTRPAIVKRVATFTTFDSYNENGTHEAIGPPSGPTSEEAFKTQIFQGAEYYATESLQCLISVVGGRVFKITPTNAGCEIEEIPLDKRNRNTLTLAYMVQADRYFIIQDGESLPIILDAIVARRAGKDEVPVGTIMPYGMGRLIVVLNSGEIVFGDIFNGKGNLGADVLKFTETGFLNEGGSSRLPPLMGRPTAAAFYPQQDTALGQGELIVFGESGAESFFLSIPRDQWKQSAFQRDALLGVGGFGHRAVTDVNGDLWFRAQDGWRSYRQARAEVNQWSQIPLSTPVRNYVEAETPWLLDYGSAIHFDNKLLVTCTPIPNAGRLYHSGLLALDFDILSSFGKNFEPAWDGHAFGELKALQIVKGVFDGEERAFVLGIDENNENAVYEITRRGVDDSSGPIPWEIVTRRMDCQAPTSEKILIGGDIWVSDVVTNNGVPISVDFRSDEHDEWVPWHSFNAISQNGVVGRLSGGVPTSKPGQAPRKRLPTPRDDCDPETKRLLRRGYEFQFRISGTGHCRIRKFRMHATVPLEDSRGDCA